VVDKNGLEVGYLLDVLSARVLRRAGEDYVTFQAPASGLEAGPMLFFHSDPGCTDQRQVYSNAGPGLAYDGRVFGQYVFFTKKVDPYAEFLVPIHAVEVVMPGSDALAPGTCVPQEGQMSVGPALFFTDPALAALSAPFHIK
jgi:hypothetical protein